MAITVTNGNDSSPSCCMSSYDCVLRSIEIYSRRQRIYVRRHLQRQTWAFDFRIALDQFRMSKQRFGNVASMFEFLMMRSNSKCFWSFI